MKKFRMLVVVILSIMMLIVFVNLANCQEKTYILRITHSTSPQDWMYQGYERFIKQIEEKSNGRIKCEHYHSSQMTVDRTAIEYVRDNIAQLSSSPGGGIIASVINDKRWLIFEIPFYFGGNDDDLYKIADGKAVGMLMDEFAKKINVKIFGIYNVGWSDIGNTKREVKSLADFKGLKIRIPEIPVQIKVYNALGCNATPMNYGEVYTALQQKTVDGIRTMANLFITSKFAEFTKYHNEMGADLAPHVSFMNKDFYESLPSDLQQIVDEIMRDTLIWWRKASTKAQEESYSKLEAMGVKVTRMTPEFLAECKAAVQPVIDEVFIPAIGQEFMDMVEIDWKESKRAF